MFDQEFSSDPNKNDDTKQAQSGQESMTQNSASGDDVSSHSSASQSGTSQSDVSGRSAGAWQGSSSGQNGAAGQSGSYSRGTGAWQGGASGQGGSYGQSTGWQNGTYGQNAGTWQNSAAGQNASYGQNSAAGQNASYGQNSTYGQNAGAWQNGASGQSGTDRYGRGWQHGNAGQNTAQGTASQGSNGAYSGQNAYRGQNAWQSYQGNYQYGNGNGDYGTVPGKKKKEKKQKEKKPGRPMNPFWKKALAVVLSAACFGVIAGVSFLAVASLGGYQNSVASATAPAVSESQSTDAGADTQSDDSGNSASVSQGTTSMVVTDVTEVVDQVMPAIVAITNESVTSIESFWGQTYEQQQESAGSGIIIGKNDDELLIVTNNHVVKDANQLYVSFIDNSIVEAQVKGTSPSMDLAVVAVKLNNIESDTMNAITIATLGDSDSLKVGEPVIAIGNALGYGQSVTTGVVSALNRVLEVDETGTSNAMIQTDAAINPGNSGGALLDINGQVIGINSNKIGGNAIEGMGYAIPISAAQPIIEQLMNQETREALDDTQKGYLGISCINVTSAMAEAYGMPEGIYVAQVYPGTGAAEAGIVKGDIITGVNGMTVTTQDDLLNAMQYYAIGETIEITVMHGNPTEGYAEETRTVTLTSQEMMNSAQQ
ncbi:MAG TPA: trypsin-like peptidase domain-containing protein [Candidatus Eisenbergiella intestinipullorum]|nr:trypsin-like peptidase domain-containing protein [Candidatus Eisenbergiella intestinipullorum]